MTPPQIVHLVTGSAKMQECSEATGICYVCGGDVRRGVSVERWIPNSFTGQTTVACPGSKVVCESCCFVMSRISQVPGRPAKEGKSFGGNYRNYSHLWEPEWKAPAFGDDGRQIDGYANASKGQKNIIRAFLEREHASEWFAAIADSGQKHVLPYAQINPPGRSGIVLFDEQRVTVPKTTELVNILCQMLTDGATKEELERGDYRPQTWQRLGRDRIREFEADHGATRGGWFSLALWLSQRDESAVEERIAVEKAAAEEKKAKEKNVGRKAKDTNRATRKPADREHRGRKGPDASIVQRPTANELLGTDLERSPVVRAPIGGSGGMDHVSPEASANNDPVQLGLFGDQEPRKPMRRARISP